MTDAVRRDRLAAIAIAAFAVLAYLPVWNAGFVLDDHTVVESGGVVARGDLAEILRSGYWAGTHVPDASLYRPVTIATFALERAATGAPSSRLAHVVNVVLHIATSLVLFRLTRRLGGSAFAAAVAGLMFALHPVHVEAVAGIVGRSDVLATLFTLLAILAYARAQDRDGGHRVAAWIAAGFLFLALGSKEVAIAGVVLLPAYDILFRPPRGRSPRAWLIERGASLAPAALAVVVHLALRVRALQAFAALQVPHPVDNPMVALSGPDRFVTALALLGRYAGLLFAPIRQSADYSGHVIGVENRLLAPWSVLGLLVLSGLVVMIVRPLLTRDAQGSATSPIASFACLLFLLPYLVIGNMLVLVGVMFSERFSYLPSSGFCILAGLFLAYLAFRYPAFQSWNPDQRVRYVGVIGACILASFALLTFTRAAAWRDDRTLYTAVVAAYPDSPRGHLHLGKLAEVAGDHDEALDHLGQAVELQPDYFGALHEYGTLLARTGRLADAVPILKRAVATSPQDGVSRLNLGLALRRLGRPDDAWSELRKAVVIDPTLDRGWAEIGHLNAEQGRHAVAAEAYRVAIGLGRQDLAPRLADVLRWTGVDPTSHNADP